VGVLEGEAHGEESAAAVGVEWVSGRGVISPAQQYGTTRAGVDWSAIMGLTAQWPHVCYCIDVSVVGQQLGVSFGEEPTVHLMPQRVLWHSDMRCSGYQMKGEV
jgi:hypothetical protein